MPSYRSIMRPPQREPKGGGPAPTQQSGPHDAMPGASAELAALSDGANRSTAVQTQFALQRMLNGSPPAAAQAKLAQTLSGRPVQRQPYARDANGQRVDLGAAHWTPATLQALLDSLSYQAADRYEGRINAEIARRGGAPAGAALVAPAPPAPAPIAAAGNAIVGAQNALRHGMGGVGSTGAERQPIVADTERDERAAKSAGSSAAAAVVGGVVSLGTGGISSYVRAGAAAGERGVRAAQIDGLLTEAEAAARGSHSAAETAAAAPAGLAGALRTIRNCLLLQAGGAAAAGVIPFAGTFVNAAVGDELRAASNVIWAHADNNEVARRAAVILELNRASAASKYGSNDTSGGGAAGGGGGGGGAAGGAGAAR